MATKFSHEGKTINHTNATGTTIKGGDVFAIGSSGKHAVAITDIEPNKVGAGYRCGVWKFAAGAFAGAVGDDFALNLTTQVFDAGGAVIGEVDEIVGSTVHVLINGLPGTASTR